LAKQPAPILRSTPLHWPWTLWRSTFLELWRLVILSSVVLVSVLALAASVRYIADGRLGPVDALIFISWGLLPMLQYALPFAGGFGATLAYHRMAQDNELVAAGGGGVSHRAILVPALASGLLLGGFLWVLTSEVIPGQLYRMERMVYRDVSRIVHASLDSGQAFAINRNMMVRADSVRRLGPDPERGIYERLSLTGVAAIELDDSGKVVGEATASHALVAFAQVEDAGGGVREMGLDGPRSGSRGSVATGVGGPGSGDTGPSAPLVTRVSLVLRHAYRSSDRSGMSGMVESLPIHFARPEFLSDKPKYLSNRDLARLPRNPDRLNHIDNMRRDLARAIAQYEVVQEFRELLAQDGRVQLTDGSGQVYSVRAGGMVYSAALEGWELTPLEGDERIEVERYHPDRGAARTVTRFSAQQALIRADAAPDPLQSRTGLTLRMREVRTQGSHVEAGGERPELAYTGLAPADDPLPRLLEHSSHEMIAEAGARMAAGRADEGTAKRMHNLEERLERLEREVISKLHERWASSAASLVMVLAGAVTAMRLGASLPLTVYLWSFFPALLAVMTISAGEHIAHKMGLSGLVVLWSGVGVLTIYTLGAFLLVRKH
jgi:lipopolysaccharide export LptBFGC system permease protein LptF